MPLGHTERSRLAIPVNDAVGRGEITGPVPLSRDHLDAAAAVMPFRRSELEEPGELVSRIEEASRYIDRERLALSPQCGFGTSIIGTS
jgi:urocanate hydratase